MSRESQVQHARVGQSCIVDMPMADLLVHLAIGLSTSATTHPLQKHSSMAFKDCAAPPFDTVTGSLSKCDGMWEHSGVPLTKTTNVWQWVQSLWYTTISILNAVQKHYVQSVCVLPEFFPVVLLSLPPGLQVRSCTQSRPDCGCG